MKITDYKRDQLSKAMQQYYDFKIMHPDCIIFFQLGDFYEMFFEDALYASEAINLTLTKKSAGLEHKVPMSGIPISAVNDYVKKLLILNKKVAIIDQDDNVETGKLVKRQLKKIITPGSYVDELEKSNNFIGCVYVSNSYDFAYADVTTGECYFVNFSSGQEVVQEIKKLAIKEVIDTQNALYNFENYFSNEGISHNSEFSCTADSAQLILLEYISVILCNNISHLSDFKVVNKDNYLVISSNAQEQLELVCSLSDSSEVHTLVEYLDNTCSAMGKRQLSNAVLYPLRDLSAINERLDLVQKFSSSSFILGDMKDCLKSMYDIERLIFKISQSSISPKEMYRLFKSLSIIPRFSDILSQINYDVDFNDLYEYSSSNLYAIDEYASKSYKDGNIFIDGYNSEIDRLRKIKDNSNTLLLEYENTQKEISGIKNLKVKYNKVFGYFIEVTNSFIQKVPQNYVRKQTMTNCERYITDELKEIEMDILNASDLLIEIEKNLFVELKDTLIKHISDLRFFSRTVGYIDFISSMSSLVIKDGLVRPSFVSDNSILINDCFHPVVSRNIDNFVHNDVFLDQECDISLITGPNMAGKSTYMRQTLICIIMAQMGSYVPCGEYKCKVFDKIYTRIGASDDLSRGLSTFMVEMQETASALKNMTHDSIVVFDELGRGTSTYDGISLAHAVINYVAKKKVKTMFSTHYHELINLDKSIPNLKNFHVNASKSIDGLIFSHKVKQGSVQKSFGIEVAMMAHLPDIVINEAKQILKSFETDKKEVIINDCDMLQEIKSLNLDEMTPMQVVNFINNFQKNL